SGQADSQRGNAELPRVRSRRPDVECWKRVIRENRRNARGTHLWIIIHSCGEPNVVATTGTRITYEHARALERRAPRDRATRGLAEREDSSQVGMRDSASRDALEAFALRKTERREGWRRERDSSQVAMRDSASRDALEAFALRETERREGWRRERDSSQVAMRDSSSRDALEAFALRETERREGWRRERDSNPFHAFL